MRLFLRPLLLSFTTIFVTLAWPCCVHLANAQTPSQPPGRLEQTTKNISNQKLDATAAALEQVASLKEDYQQRIKAADPADRDRLAEEANDALVKAVTDKGLSVEEYTSILEEAENNPDVREKILQRMHPTAK
jgi:hypothetical protein